MNYDELFSLIQKRINKREEKVITEEEAVCYLGEETVDKIDLITRFASDYGFQIFSHGSFQYQAQRIIEEGYHYSSSIISREEFVKKTKRRYPESLVVTKGQVDEDGTLSYSIFQPDEDLGWTAHDLSQHFCLGEISYADWVARFVPHNGNIPCDCMLIALIPPVERSYFSDKYTITYDKEDGEYTYWLEDVLESQLFVGYLDVRNKKMIFNPNFDMLHLLKDNKRAQALTVHEPLIDLIVEERGKKL